ncbi:sarcosine oxidase subunit beta family protein [Paracoccaceae bacterium]|nr:sarcosine oxidase subunit beta family protein [Paracoccaceae bacterium]MDC3204991.1 sarcosine oxidase subunit beta family protein [Paracoccaceae bacterium]
MRFSALRILKESLTGNKNWTPHWRNPSPKSAYDVIIVGGGGHGLSTAYYLAQNHGIRNVAVLEKGHIGSGNIGRNTTIVRANYLLKGNSEFYSHSLKLWEGLERDLNYNVMMSQRGLIMLCHSDGQRDAFVRRANAMRSRGDDAHMLSVDDLRKLLPYLNYDNARFPIYGGLLQKRAGTARHDAVAWGYARAADERGVDLIQNCEVTGFNINNGRVTGVETSRGKIEANKVAIVVAGRSSEVAQMAGIRLPIESHILQAFVTEGLKPVINNVISFGMGHFYISQSDKGGLVFGGDLDGYASYAQRGNLPLMEHVFEAGMALMPMIGKAKVLRSWGGIMDMSPDGSPIIDKTSIDGLFINCGWCYGGFKAVPASGYAYAHLIATENYFHTASNYRFERFKSGYNLMDEEGTGSQHNLH